MPRPLMRVVVAESAVQRIWDFAGLSPPAARKKAGSAAVPQSSARSLLTPAPVSLCKHVRSASKPPQSWRLGGSALCHRNWKVHLLFGRGFLRSSSFVPSHLQSWPKITRTVSAESSRSPKSQPLQVNRPFRFRYAIAVAGRRGINFGWPFEFRGRVPLSREVPLKGMLLCGLVVAFRHRSSKPAPCGIDETVTLGLLGIGMSCCPGLSHDIICAHTRKRQT